MKRWKVDPAMTRGSKKNFKEKENADLKQVAKKRNKTTMKLRKNRAFMKTKKRTKESKKEGKEKKPKLKTVPVLKSGELTAANFRRHQEGRDNIIACMKELDQLDINAFPNAPCFTDEGVCRLKFDGANTIKWGDLLKMSPKVFESLSLAFTL